MTGLGSAAKATKQRTRSKPTPPSTKAAAPFSLQTRRRLTRVQYGSSSLLDHGSAVRVGPAPIHGGNVAIPQPLDGGAQGSHAVGAEWLPVQRTEAWNKGIVARENEARIVTEERRESVAIPGLSYCLQLVR